MRSPVARYQASAASIAAGWPTTERYSSMRCGQSPAPPRSRRSGEGCELIGQGMERLREAVEQQDQRAVSGTGHTRVEHQARARLELGDVHWFSSIADER